MRRGGGWKVIAAAVALSSTALCDAADPFADLLACRDIADATARLQCFDREAAGLAPASKASAKSASPAAATVVATPAQPPAAKAAQPIPPAPTSPAAPASPPAVDSQQQFGLSEGAIAKQEIAAGTRPSKISKIEAHIVRTAHASDGHLIFTLDNDQVWRQLEAEEILIKPGEAVTVSRASLGSFWLKMSSGRGCKVTRLR
jgi:hypothetical protein